jgi:hypothetical protein
MAAFAMGASVTGNKAFPSGVFTGLDGLSHAARLIRKGAIKLRQRARRIFSGRLIGLLFRSCVIRCFIEASG